jgi:hypothetical protein
MRSPAPAGIMAARAEAPVASDRPARPPAGSAVARLIDRRYADPLDLVWLHAVARLGWRVERSPEVFASWDGERTLTISTNDDLDPDDSLAQLLFHELCHALVEAAATEDAALARPDWGLNNRDDRHLHHEHACHRVQAALAGAHGLRRFLAPTTDHRPYYDGLPDDPLHGPDDDPAVAAARAGHARAKRAPFAAVLEEALGATAALARLVAPVAPAGSLWRDASLDPAPPPTDHPAPAPTGQRSDP